jgi:hypothetical protein
MNKIASESIKKKSPMYVERCKRLDTCYNGKHRDCVGCNVWNYLYDIDKLLEWCTQQGKDFMLFTMEMQKELID